MTAVLTLPDPTRVQIPGLRFRYALGEADADALLAVHIDRAARDGIDPLAANDSLGSREVLARGLLEAAAGARLDRYLIAEAGEPVVGYGRFTDWLEGDGMHVWLALGWVRPEWRGRGLGTAILHWQERRIRTLAQANGGPWEYAANASSTEPEATALVLDNGYRPGYTVLEMGLDWDVFAAAADPDAWPQGFDRRSATVADAPAVARSVMEAYKQEYPGGRFSVATNPEPYAVELSEPPYDPALWQVAWDGDEVAGQVITKIERGRAEIYEVSVRPAYRRRGLARALVTRALLDLRARGVAVVRLGTVAEFPTRAKDLYRSLGFRVLKEFPRYRKPSGAA